MTTTESTIDHENVNGVKLSLKIDSKHGSQMSRVFTISYKNEKSKSSWSKTSLILAVLFNILAFTYVRINITAILVIIITFAFLAFFWITHSVQSEILLVIPTVGIQSSVKYVCGREDNFLPWSSIDDVIINEVVKMNRVLYFLTVLVKPNNQRDSESEAIKLMPLFKANQLIKPLLTKHIKPRTLSAFNALLDANPDCDVFADEWKYTKPRLVMLEKIYSELQILLMETQREHLQASGDKG